MKIHQYVIALVSSVFILASCDKKNDKVKATVIDTQDLTIATGCGYILLLEDGAYVKPSYLPSAYQHNNMKVEVKYHHTGIIDTCDFGTKIYDRASITDIKKINDR